MLNRLQIIEERYNKIQEMLQDGEIVKDVKKMTSLMKEMRSLEKIVEKYHDYRDTSEQIKELKIMAKDSDPEISEMAEAELANAEVKLPKLEEELKILLLPKDPMMRKMLFLKSVELLVVMKEIFLLVTYLECILDTPKAVVGKLKYYQLKKLI